jgi:DNA polymerase
MTKNTSDLLIGNLWQLDRQKIAHLRSQYVLPESPLDNLKVVSTEPLTRDTTSKPTVTETKIVDQLVPHQSIMPQAIKLEEIATEIKDQSTTKTTSPPKSHLIHDWQQLINQVSGCEECKLCYGRTQVVIERGNRQASWMFIGEGPGAQEDLQGLPFVGASGQLLDKMIAAMKLDPANDIYIANVIKCRPPHNRNPEADEIKACQNYLLNQIKLVKPQIIITLGRYAAQTLLNTDIAVGKLRKRIHQFENIPLIVTYHPSYLLRTPDAKREAWEDLQLAMQTFAKR